MDEFVEKLAEMLDTDIPAGPGAHERLREAIRYAYAQGMVDGSDFEISEEDALINGELFVQDIEEA